MFTERTSLLVGQEGLQNLQKASVMVVGLGGVGAYAAEAIARAGVGKMIIIDGDNVSESNINRQLVALRSTIGKTKAEVLAQRIKDINPNIELTVISEYIRDERMKEILEQNPTDWVVDAIDTLSPKLFLLIHCYRMKRKVVSSMGSGGKLDPSKVTICDISQTYNCPLASHIRKHLHKQGIYEGIAAVFSPEEVKQEYCREEIGENKRTTVGTISYMPAIFGLSIASVVIRSLVGVEAYKKVKDTRYYKDKKEFKQ
ncbi:MAG: tRNA threonylcarbamoyladenosine dehydratase [Bacteroidales bacterium]|nr:tRNA threonylcarbamoyladenosine dehydratase [Bacteroidales bacterium]